MGIFDFIKNRFGGGTGQFTGDRAAALKKYKLNPKTQNINFVDIKTDYSLGRLQSETFFQHISANHPDAILTTGLDPALRDEVNFNSHGGKTSAFQGTGAGNCYRFIFAFKCNGASDKTLNRSLKRLGWLERPAGGEDKYLYIFRQPAGTEYFSSRGTLNGASEVMFPHRIDPSDIVTICTLRWGAGANPAVTNYGRMQMGTHRNVA